MLKARVLTKVDTSVNWRTNNPVLLEGESGYESDTNLTKMGDGTSHWNDLAYTNAGMSSLASTANYAKNAGALGGTSAANLLKKFDNYVLTSRVEATMSTASATDKIPTSQAVIAWVKAQNFAGSGDVTTWEDF